MPLIDIGPRCIELSRVPSVGEHIIIPGDGEHLVTRVAHLPETPRSKGARAVVTLVPAGAEEPLPALPPPARGDVHLILRRRR